MSEMERDVATVLAAHEITGISGGTAEGSRWECRCGATGITGGTRDYARTLGRAHLAEALAPLIAERERVAAEAGEGR